MTQDDLNKILTKPGYGISGSISRSTIGKSQIGKSKITSQISDTGAIDDMERDTCVKQVGSKGLQIRCAGKVRVSIKFYRHRLADYSRAISEKACLDFLQYCGALKGDSEKEIWLEDLGQEKVLEKKDERTEINLEYPEVDLDNLWEERKRNDGR